MEMCDVREKINRACRDRFWKKFHEQLNPLLITIKFYHAHEKRMLMNFFRLLT